MTEKKRLYEPAAQLVAVPGVRVDKQLCVDVFRGTKEQLVAAGLAPAGLFPGEPGMPLASVMLWPRGTARGAGYRVPGRLCLSRNPSGMFTAALTVSKAEQERRQAEKDAEEALRTAERDKDREAEKRIKAADEAKGSLSRMFTTESEYRRDVIARLRTMVSMVVENTATPSTWHAFTIDDASRDYIFASFDAVVAAVVGANVRFDAEHHRAIAQGYRATIAAGDAGFQAKVASLVSLAPHTADGGAQ
jgi:hypothetical protein